MPGSDGPCRFGAYKELHQLVAERLGYGDRVRIWSPPFGDYFQGLPPGFGAIVFAGFVAADQLRDVLYDVRPLEIRARRGGPDLRPRPRRGGRPRPRGGRRATCP